MLKLWVKMKPDNRQGFWKAVFPIVIALYKQAKKWFKCFNFWLYNTIFSGGVFPIVACVIAIGVEFSV